MTAKELDNYFCSLLNIEDWTKTDSSLNGLQVDNSGGEVKKIAFAVDASIETFSRTAASGADALFVHHGLFWGNAARITDGMRRRIKFLLDNDIALFAAHLPLDAHPALGNNAVLAEKLDLVNISAFGNYHGRKIGFKGELSAPVTLEDAAQKIAFNGQPAAALLPFGKKLNTSCAIISGGAAMEAVEAINEGADMYITGECSHSVYHIAYEASLNMLCGGHYATEVWGVLRLAEKTKSELGIETCFIDVPTGL
jgi:dinuclear metal center YbgI/SA1388 family protein